MENSKKPILRRQGGRQDLFFSTGQLVGSKELPCRELGRIEEDVEEKFLGTPENKKFGLLGNFFNPYNSVRKLNFLGSKKNKPRLPTIPETKVSTV